jgi:hypothetical protein
MLWLGPNRNLCVIVILLYLHRQVVGRSRIGIHVIPIRGKSGLQWTSCQVTPGHEWRELFVTESATENRPPPLRVARVKRWGKSPPRSWQQWAARKTPAESKAKYAARDVCLDQDAAGRLLENMGDHVRREMIVRITRVTRQNPAYRPFAYGLQQPPTVIPSEVVLFRNEDRIEG